MSMQLHMHDLQAQDLPFLNGTDSFKGLLLHA